MIIGWITGFGSGMVGVVIFEVSGGAGYVACDVDVEGGGLAFAFNYVGCVGDAGVGFGEGVVSGDDVEVSYAIENVLFLFWKVCEGDFAFVLINFFNADIFSKA